MNATSTQTSARDFFLNLGAFAALYVAVVNIVTLLFQFINTAIPDAAAGGIDPYSSTLRWSIASLIVVFPLYIVLTRMANRDVQAHPEKEGLWIRRWGIYLTLFIAGIVIAGDLIFLVNSFLGGELTSRFVLKVASIAVVLAAVFGYYAAALRGYWVQYPQRSHFVGYGAGSVLIVMLVAGFMVMGSPAEQRALRLDQERVNDLQQIQSRVVDHWRAHDVLPTSLDELSSAVGITHAVPRDPETDAAYTYRTTDDLTFELCAVFARASQDTHRSPISPSFERDAYISDPDTGAIAWQHPAGEHCFTRQINPEYFSDR